MVRRSVATALGVLAILAGPGGAQESAPRLTEDKGAQSPRVQVRSPILTVDSEQLFERSDVGQAILAEIQAAGASLQARNDEIVAELQAEEQSLTEQRPTMEPEAFRELADAFDEKAQRIRQERGNELEALNRRLDRERRGFLAAAAPIIEEIMQEAGAAVVVDQRDVLISNLAVDITAIAIRRINEQMTRDPAPVSDVE